MRTAAYRLGYIVKTIYRYILIPPRSVRNDSAAKRSRSRC